MKISFNINIDADKKELSINGNFDKSKFSKEHYTTTQHLLNLISDKIENIYSDIGIKQPPKYKLENSEGNNRYIYCYSFEDVIKIDEEDDWHYPDYSNICDLGEVFEECGSFQKILDAGVDDFWGGYYYEETDYSPNFEYVSHYYNDNYSIDVYDVSNLDFNNLSKEESEILYNTEHSNILVKYEDKTYLLNIVSD